MSIYSESRPWGRFGKFNENKPGTVKLIYVNPSSRLSLQITTDGPSSGRWSGAPQWSSSTAGL